MKPIKPILTLCLLACLFIAPAAADNSTDLHTPIEGHPLNLTLAEVRENIKDIIQSNLRPDEKLTAQTEVLGMDARLLAYLNAEKDMETGEPIYPENIPVITTVLSWFGWATVTPDEPYNKEQGDAAYSAYLSRYVSEYKPTGTFGGPIE